MTRHESRLPTAALFLAALALCGASAVALGGPAVVFSEIEPNDDKAQANEVELFGSANITSLSGTGNPFGQDRDYFRLATAPLAAPTPRLRRYQLDVDYISSPLRCFVRGLSQTAAGLVLSSDAPVQSSKLEFNTQLVWYGFGKGEQLFFDAGDMDFFRFDYEVDVAGSNEFHQTIFQPFEPGEITITSVGQGHVTDTDLWVYDVNFNALPGYGNDDDPVLQSTRSTLTRRYAPGRYYLAITDGNLANDERAAADDLIQSEPVLDFPDGVTGSSLDPSADLSFAITDSLGTLQVDARKQRPLDVLWFAIDVGSGQSIQAFCGAGPGSACPCANHSITNRGDGCVNSTGRGALLYASGSTSLSSDDLCFHGLGLPSAHPALLFSGDVSLAPGSAFGDGLRCVAGNVARLDLRVTDGQGKVSWEGAAGLAGFGPGETGYFQAIYRDGAGPCGEYSNTTNAVQVLFEL